jgi:hypothetical protein
MEEFAARSGCDTQIGAKSLSQKHLFNSIITAWSFLACSPDSTANPDAAIQVMESMSADLQQLDPDLRDSLHSYVDSLLKSDTVRDSHREAFQDLLQLLNL